METPKFKVGDRVRRNSKYLSGLEQNGDVGTVQDASVVPFVMWDRAEVNNGPNGRPEGQDRLELINYEAPSEPIPAQAPTPKHTTYTPDGVTISMELEWEIARLLGICQALGGSDIKGQCEKINQMWMGK